MLYYGRDIPPEEQEERTLCLENLRCGSYRVSIYSVGYQKNDAHTAFLKMPRKESLSRAEVEALKSVSDGSPEQVFTVQIQDGRFVYNAVLRDNDVMLITLEYQQ